MRALSLTSLAALVFLTACSETTAPLDSAGDTLAPTGTLTAQVVLNDWFPAEPYVFEGCGETFTFVGETDHIVLTETVTPSGQYQWYLHYNTQGGMIYADPSGDVYRASPFAAHGALHEDLDGNMYGFAGGGTAVAKGVNVDKRLRLKEAVKILVTPDGTVIHDYFIQDVECR